jgi:hypothetical protein
MRGKREDAVTRAKLEEGDPVPAAKRPILGNGFDVLPATPSTVLRDLAVTCLEAIDELGWSTEGVENVPELRHCGVRHPVLLAILFRETLKSSEGLPFERVQNHAPLVSGVQVIEHPDHGFEKRQKPARVLNVDIARREQCLQRPV